MRLNPSQPYQLGMSLGSQRLGSQDPTCRITAQGLAKAFWTPEGPCTLGLEQGEKGLEALAVGPGAAWTQERLAALFDFAPQEFPQASHPWLKSREGLLRGLRVGPVLWVMEVLVGVILQQRVTWQEAARAHRLLVERHGTPAPGGLGLRLPPRWEDLSVTRLQAAGVDLKRSRCLLACAAQRPRLEGLVLGPLPQTRDFLARLPGVGPWTREMTMGRAFGDADAAPEGDLHLPRLVGLALQGAPGDDPRMLELLEPYRGCRFRVILGVLRG